MALDGTSSCCGTSWCECDLCFDVWVCRIRDHIFPDTGGQLVCGGVFEGLMAAMLKPLWDIYREQCLLCDFARESNPATACCLLRCWANELGVPDDCFDAEVCFTDESQVNIALSAQVIARAMLEFGGQPDLAFYKSVACILGVDFDVLVTTPTLEVEQLEICDIVGQGGLQTPAADVGADCGPSMIVTGQNCFRPCVRFNITHAPPTIYATVCSPVSQPLCWNPYIDAFKCLVGKLKPCDVSIEITQAASLIQTEPPVLERICPNDLGLYVAYGISGTGTEADPLFIDFDHLTPTARQTLASKLAAM